MISGNIIGTTSYLKRKQKLNIDFKEKTKSTKDKIQEIKSFSRVELPEGVLKADLKLKDYLIEKEFSDKIMVFMLEMMQEQSKVTNATLKLLKELIGKKFSSDILGHEDPEIQSKRFEPNDLEKILAEESAESEGNFQIETVTEVPSQEHI